MMSHLRRLPRRVWRLQRGSPGVTALTTITLAAGIGAATTVFSVVDPVLLRPLPFDRPAELRLLTTGFPRMNMTGMGLSGPEALELPRLTHVFADAGAVTFATATVRSGDAALRAEAALASAAALDALRPRLIAGAVYGADADRPGAAPVALLGEAFWRRALGADPAILGRSLLVDGRATTVVGVLARRVDLLDRQIDVWQPLMLTQATAGSRADHRFTVLARIRRGVTAAAAAADVDAAVAGWQQATGEFHSPAPSVHPLEMRTLAEATRGPVFRPLAALAGAVVLLLLIACANAANLLLTRGEARRAQAAVEVALGAGLRHLAVLYLGEAIVLSLAAAACGVAIAAVAIDGLRSFGPAVVRPADLAIDGRVVLFAALAAVGTSVAMAMVPVLSLSPSRAARWLRSGGRGSIGASDRQRIQRALVSVQVGVAVVLAVAAVVTARSLLALTRIDLGFRPETVMHVQVSLPQTPYANADERTWGLYERLVERAAALPGVAAAAAMSGTPPLRPANNTTFAIDGATMFDHDHVPQVDYIQHVSGDYFGAMGIPLRAGRGFSAGDTAASAPVAVVNETLARRFWPGRSPLGHRLRPFMPGVPWFTVVGVAADVRQAGVHAAAGSEMYVPYRQARVLLPDFLPRTMSVVARGTVPAESLVAGVRRIVGELEPAAAVSNAGTMRDEVDRALASPRLLASLLDAFAGIAVLLAAVGVYGVTSAGVTARTAEFGVRMALGARPRHVIGHVLRSGAPPVLAGALCGSLTAFAGVRYLSTILFAVDPWSAGSIAAMAASLAFVATAASLVPAVRATRLDPIAALRSN